jgi:hypothetical protein
LQCLRRRLLVVRSYGWWTKEGPDIVALSSLGFSWYGGGHNLALYSALPPLPLQQPEPQPTTPLPTNISDAAALAVFSFTQGDAASFDQKFVVLNLRTPSKVAPNERVVERHPFSLMATPLDSTFQPNVCRQIRSLQGVSKSSWQQGASLLGKQFGYASLSAMDSAGVLKEYCQQGADAMRRQGYLDAMINEPPSAILNDTLTKVGSSYRGPRLQPGEPASSCSCPLTGVLCVGPGPRSGDRAVEPTPAAVIAGEALPCVRPGGAELPDCNGAAASKGVGQDGR